MVTWLVILTLYLILITSCFVGAWFRLNQNSEAITRLSIALMDLKLQQAENKDL